jgi:hypothetical protein
MRRYRMPRWLRGMLMDDQFKLFIAFLCMTSGIPLIINAVSAPQVLLVALSTNGVRFWGATLGLGGFLVVFGIFMRHIKARRRYVEGLLIESAGLLSLGPAALVVACLALYVVGTKALFTACLYVAFTLACAARFWAVQVTVKRMREAIDNEQ